MKEDLGFTTKKYPAGAHLNEKTTGKTNFGKVQLKGDCLDGSTVNGRRESTLFSFRLSAPPGFEFLEKPTSILLKKVNKDEIGDITFVQKTMLEV